MRRRGLGLAGHDWSPLALPARAAFLKLQRRHVVPVLFVHGHLGSHQQMRSAASETGRELARRLAANASWPLWLQWYGADFSTEPSALDAALLVRMRPTPAYPPTDAWLARPLADHAVSLPGPCRTSKPHSC